MNESRDRETWFTQSRKVRKVRKENQGLLLRTSWCLGVGTPVPRLLRRLPLRPVLCFLEHSRFVPAILRFRRRFPLPAFLSHDSPACAVGARRRCARPGETLHGFPITRGAAGARARHRLAPTIVPRGHRRWRRAKPCVAWSRNEQKPQSCASPETNAGSNLLPQTLRISLRAASRLLALPIAL